MPVVQTVISDVVSPRERGEYQAYFSGDWMAAGLLGPCSAACSPNICTGR